MRAIAMLSSALLLGGCQNAALAQDRAANRQTVAEISAGLTHIYFDDWDGPRINVWVYVPHTVDKRAAPILMMMHGAKRSATRYLSEWDQVADEHGFIVIAPEFDREHFRGSARYNRGNVQADNGMRNPESAWTFSAIEPIFDHVRVGLGNTRQSFTLYGHSAGSQFAHRFMLFKPDAPVRRYLLANAGWYTLPDLNTPYPYGLAGTGLTEDDVRRALAKDVIVLLGNQDTDTNHESLRRSDEAERQGAHRFARGQTFFRTGKTNAEHLAVPFNWRLRVIEDVAHSNGGMAAGSGDLIE